MLCFCEKPWVGFCYFSFLFKQVVTFALAVLQYWTLTQQNGGK